jgi:hypothetical protein
MHLDPTTGKKERKGPGRPRKPRATLDKSLKKSEVDLFPLACSDPFPDHLTSDFLTSDIQPSSSKSENSLHGLTRKFLNLLESDPTNSIDLNTAAYHLNISKRRVYDITNVLEGLDLLEKSSVNVVRWIGPMAMLKQDDEDDENNEQAVINELCEEIAEMTQMNFNKSLFVTTDDLDRSGLIKGKHAFIVKVDENVKVEFIGENGEEICVRAEKGGKIEVSHLKTDQE